MRSKKDPNYIGIAFETCSSLYIDKYNYIAEREHLYVTNFTLSIGDFSNRLGNNLFTGKVSPNIDVGFLRLADDGDAVTGIWNLAPSAGNSFKITNINYTKNTFTGSYNFYFYENYGGNSVAPYSKQINFLNGKFTLPIPK